MNDNSGSSDSGRPEDNPFRGTPFEQIFGAFTQPGAAGMPDLSAMLGHVQAFMAPHDGPLNWETVTDVARRVAAQSPDPTPSRTVTDAIADSVRLADHWLDTTTGFTSGVTTTAAWSRADWIVETMAVWKVLVEPIAEAAVSSLANALPEEARALAGPILGMLKQATSAMVATQVANGVGALASEVLSASDIGLPLGPAGKAALLPHNVEAFAEGLDVTQDDVLLYLSLREAAHQRLFANVGWLRTHLTDAVASYGAGIAFNTAGLEEKLSGIDPMNPQAVQDAMEGGLFDLDRSPAQQAALERLEVTLALVEGWVDEVVTQATEHRMPAAARLHEITRRRRAAGGPAEQTFASLVGLELRPRRLRDASTLWGSLRTRQGAEARDGVWTHPDLLPSAADLDDPLGFREDAVAPTALSDDAFEAGLRDLLEGGTGEGGVPPSRQ